MATRVDANSLSDITQLAANPPKYPRNPTEIKRESLILYIARVPGTRDIILTTLKPQLKNVTASDVESSLYYLHLNTDEDARLLEEERNIKSDTESLSATQKPLPRKPLPDSTRSSLDINPQTAPILARLDSHSSLTTKRKPVANTDDNPNVLNVVKSKTPLSRRPLGPRPQTSDVSIGRKPILSDGKQQSDDLHSLTSRTASPSRPGEDTTSISNNPKQNNVDSRRITPGFSITIIRRDPSTESQWNIGTITGSPETKEGTHQPTIATQQAKRLYFNMSIHLTNPGYTRFRHSHVTSQTVAGNNRASLLPQTPLGSEGGAGKQCISYGFDREIWMEGSDFWGRSSFHKRSRSDLLFKKESMPGKIFNEAEGVNVPESAIADASGSSSQAKGYMFLSPWGGRCKFSTSSSGRSLRCRHTLPEPVSASRDAESSPPPQASVAVSEIRFNLPSADIFHSVTDSFTRLQEGGHASFDQIRNRLSSHKPPPPLPPRPHPNAYVSRSSNEFDMLSSPSYQDRASFNTSSDDEALRNSEGVQRPSAMDAAKGEEDDHHFDLSLGKEKAGGGNRGKRAKLGKLIIHDEGFKFLDLLVSANMAVWWSVWEPDF